MKKRNLYTFVLLSIIAFVVPLFTVTLGSQTPVAAAVCKSDGGTVAKDDNNDGKIDSKDPSYSDGQQIQTSVIDIGCPKKGQTLITTLLVYVINFLTAGVAIAALGGIVYGAVLYSSSGDNADQAKRGIAQVRNAVIAIILFIFMFAIVNFLVPGGLFKP